MLITFLEKTCHLYKTIVSLRNKIKYYETFFTNTFGLSVFYYACGPPSARESTVPNDTVPISISNLYGNRRNKMSRHRLPPFARPSPLLCHRLLVHVDGACE